MELYFNTIEKTVEKGIRRPLIKGLRRATVRASDVLALFSRGEQGAWYDPSDLTTLYQDAAGTTPVTADGDPVGYMADKSGNGNHATQSTAADRPVYRTDGTLHWLEFDGVDDVLTATTAATDLIDAGIAVATGLATSQSQQRFAWGDTNDDGQNRLNIHPSWLGNRFFDAFSTDTGRIEGQTSITETVVSLGNADGSLRVMRQNGVEVLSGTSSDTASGLTVINIVDEAELMNFYGGLILSRAFTHSNITSIESYLASKSGVTL